MTFLKNLFLSLTIFALIAMCGCASKTQVSDTESENSAAPASVTGSTAQKGKKRSFFQPEGDIAKVTYSATGLKSAMWSHSWIDITFYDGCNPGIARDNGVLGGFKLSSDPDHEYGKEHTIKLAAGKPAIFEMGMISGFVCTGKIRFTPEVGHHYKFTYHLSGGRCAVVGQEILKNGETAEIPGMEQFKNKDILFGLLGTSGSRDSAWRRCGKMEKYRIK